MRAACCRVTQGAISFATKIQRENSSSTLKEAALWKKQHSESSSTLKEAG
jgi:hypothetical protein